MLNRRSFLKETGVMPLLFSAGLTAVAASEAAADERPSVEIVGDWQVRVSPGTVNQGKRRARISQPITLTVAPAAILRVEDEKYDTLPLYDANAAPWGRGARLRQLTTFETTAADSLLPESLVVKAGPGKATPYAPGKDYALEPRWATFGRVAGGGLAEGQPVWADYTCGWGRLDTIAVGPQGNVRLVQGTPHNATPRPPDLEKGELALVNLWIAPRLPKLTPEALYPVVESAYPEPKRRGKPAAATLLPKTWAKLNTGQPVHVLAWGDSVTAGGQASDPAHQYQSQFVALLQKQFPKASIRLTTAGWGGRNSDSFLQEPPGSPYNFESAVLAPRPDLIVMEFVNDAFMTPAVVEQKYASLQKRFAAIGAEWVILTPHFVRPDWMGAPSPRVESDPRPYVAGVRQFAAKHNVALADASLRWGHLLKEGVPYTTLLSNSINHPNDQGHTLFAQALMELFR
jgi:lysophospholipase L1-like esterase